MTSTHDQDHRKDQSKSEQRTTSPSLRSVRAKDLRGEGKVFLNFRNGQLISAATDRDRVPPHWR